MTCNKILKLFYFVLLIYLGADVLKEGAPLGVFRYPSYVQDIMGYVLVCSLLRFEENWWEY